MKLPHCLLVLAACALPVGAWAQTTITYKPSPRLWWVYLTPAEAAFISRASDFADVKAEADAYAAVTTDGLPPLTQAGTGPQALTHGIRFVEESARAIELLSATYFALKHGVHQGNAAAPEIQKYRTKAVQLWRKIVEYGPAAYWEKEDNVINGKGWIEGDIALRNWLKGALASYDAIRYDIAPADAEYIDKWMAGVRFEMWDDGFGQWTSNLEKNRDMSRAAQAHIFSLLLQDKDGVNQFFDSDYGLKKALPAYVNYLPRGDKAWEDPNTTLLESSKTVAQWAPRALGGVTGFSPEHGYKTGVYGRHSMSYLLYGFAALSRAASSADTEEFMGWHLDRQANQSNITGLFTSWLGYGGTERETYLHYCKVLEDYWQHVKLNGVPARSSASNLDAGLWLAFAWKNRDFLNLAGWPESATSWSKSPGLADLWRLRADAAHISRAVAAQHFNTHTVGGTPSDWTVTAGAGLSATVQTVTAGDNAFRLVDGSTTLSVNATRGFAAQTGPVVVEWSFRQEQASRWNNFQLSSSATGARAVELYTTSVTTPAGTSAHSLVYRDHLGADRWLATISPGVWYDVKVVADPETDTFKVYLNGSFTSLADNQQSVLPFRNKVPSLDLFNVGTGSASTQSGLWIDDIAISVK